MGRAGFICLLAAGVFLAARPLFADEAEDLYNEIQKAGNEKVSDAGKSSEEYKAEVAKLLEGIIEKCETYEKRFPTGADIASVYYERAKALFFLSRFKEPHGELLEKGAAAARKAVELGPKTEAGARARGLLIQYHRMHGQLEESLKEAQAVARDFEGTAFAPLALFYIADAYDKLKKEKEALATLEELATKYKDDPFGQRAAGILAFRRLKGSVMDLSFTSTGGKQIDLKDYRGKVVLVDFWASWCPPCRAEMPLVVKTEELLRNQGFCIIGISLDSSKDEMEAFVKKENMTWPQYFDGKKWDNELARKFGVSAIPATVLVDKTGKVREIGLRGQELQQAIRKLLDEKTP